MVNQGNGQQGKMLVLALTVIIIIISNGGITAVAAAVPG